MARALALETSGRVGSVALVDDGAVLREEQFPHGLKHAAGIFPIIDRLCREQGWAPRDVAEIYVSAGPGSFTGLRVGITVAKTLAFATRARIVAVPTTEVLALNAPAGWKNVVIVLDAKRDQVFTATFTNDGSGWPLLREGARLDNLAAVLARAGRPVHLIGEGIPYHQMFIPADDSVVIVTPPELWRARAAAVAQIGYAMAQRREWTDPDRLVPIYVRKPEAEEKYDEKHGAAGAAGLHP
jgi:tRNA threonylcarbamoyladenosine biosynthesis protein TsaB